MRSLAAVAIVALAGAGCEVGTYEPLGDPSARGPDAGGGSTQADAAAGPDATAIAACRDGDDQSIYPLTSACYMLFTTATSWMEAERTCEALMPTAYLATLADAGEAAHVKGLAGGTPTWLGLTDAAAPDSYRWVTAEPLGYTEWLAAEPDASGDCALLQNTGWQDDDCAQARAYVCERPRAF